MIFRCIIISGNSGETGQCVKISERFFDIMNENNNDNLLVNAEHLVKTYHGRTVVNDARSTIKRAYVRVEFIFSRSLLQISSVPPERPVS